MRIGKIELMRFLGAVLIMNAHFGYQDRPFQLSWFFVEFFYIITGYFTMRHFEKQEPQEHFEAVKIAVEYTGKKFVQFLPYTTGAILITYIAMNWHYIGEGAFGNFIRSFENMPFEMLYLSEAAPEGSLLFYNVVFISDVSGIPVFLPVVDDAESPVIWHDLFLCSTFLLSSYI